MTKGPGARLFTIAPFQHKYGLKRIAYLAFHVTYVFHHALGYLMVLLLVHVTYVHDVAHRKALKSGSASDWSSYRQLRNKVNAMLRSVKAEYFQE